MKSIERFLQGKDSIDDVKMYLARKVIEDALSHPEYRQYLNDLRNENAHGGGWSKDRTMKARCEIPFDALAYLPDDLKKNTKALAKWIKSNYPILYVGGK